MNNAPCNYCFRAARTVCLALVLILLLVLPGRSSAGRAVCPVVKVVDGDTITVLYKGKREKIRLLNVDTPESVHPDASRNTPMGKKAAAYTRQRLAGQRVALEFEGRKRGKYGRLLAYVFIDHENFNLELVQKGWSPYYTKYGTSPSYHNQFTAAQAGARARGLNIWGPGQSTAPAHKARPRMAAASAYRGNTSSRVFHRPSCRYFNCKNCTRVFSHRDTAIAKGFSPCGICRP
ncbi:MAG: thermonuclease family protein [Desulfobacter sp.]|nr:MAG: thermonuclease family protein [Desulfobacter sp.]